MDNKFFNFISKYWEAIKQLIADIAAWIDAAKAKIEEAE